MLKNTLILIFSLLLIGSNSYAGSIKENYELQERCGKSSAEFFKKMYGTGYDTKNLTHSYTSHYNKKLNKCFIEIVSIGEDEGGQQVSLMMELYDVHENNPYAIFYKSSDKMNCSLYVPRTMKCNSQEQWNRLVKPFMNN
jgi:hypothetical protein